MEKISQIISKIENNKNCIVSKLSTPYKNIPLDIPNDLKFYLENYESMDIVMIVFGTDMA